MCVQFQTFKSLPLAKAHSVFKKVLQYHLVTEFIEVQWVY